MVPFKVLSGIYILFKSTVKFDSGQLVKFQYLFILFSFSLLILSWDIELNPGPRSSLNSLSVCHWNLNSVWVDDFQKLLKFQRFWKSINLIFCTWEKRFWILQLSMMIQG